MAADNLPNTDISHFAKETVKIEGIVLFAVRYVFAEWRATGKTVYRHKKTAQDVVGSAGGGDCHCR